MSSRMRTTERRSSVRMIGDEVGVTVWMPGRRYGALVAVAERRGVHSSVLLAEAVEIVASTEPDRDRAMSALSRGWDDRTVAEQLGVPVVRVTSWRKQLKLRAAEPGKGEGRI